MVCFDGGKAYFDNGVPAKQPEIEWRLKYLKHFTIKKNFTIIITK